MNRFFTLSFSIILFGGICSTDVVNAQIDKTLFSKISEDHSKIYFKNTLTNYEKFNVFTSQYFYNGGGVAIGDINNDGLPDIFFTANHGPDGLYLNKGNLQFEDITKKAGVEGVISWETGVAMSDINNDGWLDIYVSKSGLAPDVSNSNALYINNQDGTFTERAFEYGLSGYSHTTQAAFLDYDLDGDLDVFLLNHNIERINDQNFSLTAKSILVGDQLFRNDGSKYTEVTEEAGIIGKIISYGLGVMIGDIDKDGWPDIYVCNDFGERDYLYYNNGDGTFSEKLTDQIKHIPYYSMGGDLADINNDGWLDIMTLDMTAEDNFGQKANMNDMNPDKFQFVVDNGMHYQYMINCLQLNNGNGTFSDISMMAGMAYTNWSWAPLIIDFNNDGMKDIFISNGYRVDISNKDFVNWYGKRQQELGQELAHPETQQNFIKESFEHISSSKVKNYMFKNNGDLTFSNATTAWGLDEPTYSNGMAYADLDNDGDLDLVINNLDQNAFIYKNNGMEMLNNHYLKIKFNGPDKNKFGIGTKVKLTDHNGFQYQEFYSSRGFQSSVEPIMYFGLGKTNQISELEITWFDGKQQILKNIDVNQTITVKYSDSDHKNTGETKPTEYLFKDITEQSNINFTHVENKFDDFKREVLLPHKMSQFGPALAVADVNGDGLEDFYVGGAKGFAGSCFYQTKDGKFSRDNQKTWETDKYFEDLDATFFDSDNDGDFDLYVVSGGGDFNENDPGLQDRLYINNGKGVFTKSFHQLPEMFTSGSCVRPADFDNDGDEDLFIGGRHIPGKYPNAPRSYLLKNNSGKFIDVTESIAPDLLKPGMVTDANWVDFNGDKKLDLVVVGEWMPILMMKNVGNRFQYISEYYGTNEQTGWWYSITSDDIDDDGDMDLIAGNLGLNYKYKASPEYPFSVYSRDFDGNGKQDIVLGYYNDGKQFPVRGRGCSSQQMPIIKEQYKTYNAFAQASLTDIYQDFGLEKSLSYEAKNFASIFMENMGDGSFKISPLSNRAQISPINSIIIDDFNKDKKKDLLVAGNLFVSEVETPKADGGVGLLLTGDKKGGFKPIAPYISGFKADGDVKKMKLIKLANKGKGVIVVQNNGPIHLFEVQ